MIHTVPSYLVLATAPHIHLSSSIWQQSDTLFIHEVNFPVSGVEKVLGLDFGCGDKSTAYCYALPLIDVYGHREYCKERMQDIAQTENACRAFGISAIHKWIQE